jgi:hypothetical protein
MGIGTARSLPLGITTDARWGAARRRRLPAICALCALAAAGVLIAETVRHLMSTNSDDARATVVDRGTQPPTEALTLTTATGAIVPISSAPIPAAAIDPASVPAVVPEPPRVPTVLRGAGVKPR